MPSVSTTTRSLEERLERAVRRRLPDVQSVRWIERLPAGATQETSVFEVVEQGSPRRSILRRRPDGMPDGDALNRTTLETEARLLRAVGRCGVLVPRVEFVLEPADAMGAGYAMEWIEGETIPRRILRDEAFASARPQLARQLGEALARIHAVEIENLPELPRTTPDELVESQRQALTQHDRPQPVLELAVRWLADRTPPTRPLQLVHGDFRNGNLIVGPEGLRSVLDWELAHLGDPLEDFGWVCANVWRFGAVDQRVGGFGSLEELIDGYVSAGGQTMEASAVLWWEVLASLKWATICLGMYTLYASGLDRSIERAAIGRRLSENEIDLLNLIAPLA